MKIAGHRFLITGGSGFVGSHLAGELLERRAERVVLYDHSMRFENLGRLQAHPSVELVQASILDRRLARALVGIHGVFHLATLPLTDCAKDSQEAFDVNVRGMFETIHQAIKAGVHKLVYASASSVYGDTLEVMDERHPLDPWSMYGVSKLCGEFLLRPFLGQLPYNILRYMNVYGPRQTAGLIPAVIGKIKAGEPPIITGDGSASFDFVHVHDVARCTCLAMESDVSGEAFNVGSGTEVSVNDIVAQILDLAGSDMKPVYKPNMAGGMTRRVGNSEKARRILGFDPSISLREGLAELVKES